MKNQVPTQKAPTDSSRKQEASGLAARVEPTKWTIRKDERTIQLLDHNGKVLLQHDDWGAHHVRLFQGIADAHNASCAVKEEKT